MADQRAKQHAEMRPHRRERAGSRQCFGEQDDAEKADDSNERKAVAPTPVIGRNRANQASGKAADRVAGDVKPHREADRIRGHLVGEIGHGDGRKAG